MDSENDVRNVLVPIGCVFVGVFSAGLLLIYFFPSVLSPRETPVGIYSTESASQVASSSTMQVGPQEINTVFAANEFCANRLIGVFGSTPIVLSFDADITPSMTVGHPLVASSTTSLPPDQYGCGAVRAYAPASTTITTSEFIR